MKCGHSRNLFYVSRSCFSFSLHTFLTHIKINEICVEISFLFDISKLLVAYKHTYFAQRNRMKCGHSRNLFYVSRSCFSFNLHTSVTQQNKSNTRWDFIFIRHLKATCGWRRRPAGRQRWRRCPARCGRPSTRTTRCTDASGCSGPRTVNQCRGTISQMRELSYRPVTVLGCVSSMDLVLYRCVRFGCLCDLHRVHVLNTHMWHINTLILHNGIEWNVVIVGIYFTCLEAVFHFIYTLLWRT